MVEGLMGKQLWMDNHYHLRKKLLPTYNVYETTWKRGVLNKPLLLPNQLPLSD
jgi:hypothetical protein